MEGIRLDKKSVLKQILELDKNNDSNKLSENSSDQEVLEFLYNNMIEISEHYKYTYARKFREYIKCMNIESDKNELIKEYLCKMFPINEVLNQFIDLEDHELKSIIINSGSTECFCENLIDHYSEQIYPFNASFYSYEYCIEQLCKYYRIFKELYGYEEKFLSLLRYSISYSGESGDIGYAYKGLEKVKDNIYVLGEELIVKLLDCFEVYTLSNDIITRQIFTIIKNSKLSEEKQSKLKFFYIDRRYIESELTDIINDKIYKFYNEFDINIGEKSTDYYDNKIIKIVRNKAYKYNSDKSIKFEVSYNRFSQIDFIIKFNGQNESNIIITILYNDYKKIIQLLDNGKEIVSLNFQYYSTYSKIDYKSEKYKRLDDFIESKIETLKILTQKDLEIKNYKSSVNRVTDDRTNITPEYINIESIECNKEIDDILKQISSTIITKEILQDVKVLIEHRGASSAVDRIHTALHSYLKSVCDIKEIPYNKSGSITELFKLVNNHIIGLTIDSKNKERLDRILKTLSSLVDSLNYLRNHASFAHANEQLDEDEAVMVIDAALAILKYLNSKLYKNNIV